jgi:ribosomal protein S18 acetylase RimI-like enzyme
MIGNDPGPVEQAVTPHGIVTLRPETESDGAFLRALHDSVKGAELALLPLAEPMRRQMLDMQYRAMTMSYRSAFPAGRFEVIMLDSAPIGRLITDSGQGRFHIVYIGLLAEWRNRAIGTALMTAVLRQPRRQGTICTATVAVDNLASLRLWSRLGFTAQERGETDVRLEWWPD